MTIVWRLAALSLVTFGLAACDTYGDRYYPESGYRSSAYPSTAYPRTVAPNDRATILHQDRPGGSDYNPYQYRREPRGY